MSISFVVYFYIFIRPSFRPHEKTRLPLDEFL